MRTIPVSTHGAGSLDSEPSRSRLNCMNTRFHTSRTFGSGTPTGYPFTVSPSFAPLTQPSLTRCAASRSVFPSSSYPIRSKWISEHGPHGPVSPISQKLSFLLPRRMRSSGTNLSHSWCASSSGSSPDAGSPSKYVTYSRSAGILYTSVRSSHAHAIASAL